MSNNKQLITRGHLERIVPSGIRIFINLNAACVRVTFEFIHKRMSRSRATSENDDSIKESFVLNDRSSVKFSAQAENTNVCFL